MKAINITRKKIGLMKELKLKTMEIMKRWLNKTWLQTLQLQRKVPFKWYFVLQLCAFYNSKRIFLQCLVINRPLLDRKGRHQYYALVYF
jgi:hypothetical protein